MPSNAYALPIKAESGWQAVLNLRFANSTEKTLLTHREHKGPLTVQRPFYPEGNVCHVYMLHPPGGIVGGDNLKISVMAEANSHALLTTPAAGKYYRSEDLWANQSVEIEVANDAVVEWLPQETIIYEGAHLKNNMNVTLAENASFIGWELFTLGRPASNEKFDFGAVDLNWRIVCNNKPLLIERLRLDSNAFASRWGLQGLAACGTLFAKSAGRETLSAVQDFIGEAPNRGVTLIDDILVCRGLDCRVDLLRAFFEQVYSLVRPQIANRKVCFPRIWLT
jgi:urease accessory protein